MIFCNILQSNKWYSTRRSDQFSCVYLSKSSWIVPKSILSRFFGFFLGSKKSWAEINLYTMKLLIPTTCLSEMIFLLTLLQKVNLTHLTKIFQVTLNKKMKLEKKLQQTKKRLYKKQLESYWRWNTWKVFNFFSTI